MKTTVFLLTVALAGCVPAATEIPTSAMPEPIPKSRERALALGLIPADVPAPRPEWHETPDFGELREAYGRRVDFDGLCDNQEQRIEMDAALESRAYASVIERSGPILARCPVDALTHLFRSMAFGEAGNAEGAALHARWARGLLDSILASGTGRTPASPYVTVSIHEEYLVCNALGLRVIGQGVFEGPDGSDLDALEVESESGEQTTIYFAPRTHFVRMMYTLGI